MYDTLIKKHTVPELVAVLAHEVGHYKLKHVISNLFVSIITTGLMLFLMSKILFNSEVSYASIVSLSMSSILILFDKTFLEIFLTIDRKSVV